MAHTAIDHQCHQPKPILIHRALQWSKVPECSAAHVPRARWLAVWLWLLRALSLRYVKCVIKANPVQHYPAYPDHTTRINTPNSAANPRAPSLCSPSAICSVLWLGRRSNRRCLLSVLHRCHSTRHNLLNNSQPTAPQLSCGPVSFRCLPALFCCCCVLLPT